MIEIVKGTPEVIKFVQDNSIIQTGAFLTTVIKMSIPDKKFIFMETEPNHFNIECDKIPSLVLVLFNLIFPTSKINFTTPDGSFEIVKTPDEDLRKMARVFVPEDIINFTHEVFKQRMRVYGKPGYVLVETDRVHPVFLERLAQSLNSQTVYLSLGEMKEQTIPPNVTQLQ